MLGVLRPVNREGSYQGDQGHTLFIYCWLIAQSIYSVASMKGMAEGQIPEAK